VSRWLPAVPFLALLAALVVVPIAALSGTALELGSEELIGALAAAGPSVVGSAWTSAMATLLAVCLGTCLAVLTERTAIPGRRGLRLVMLLALIVPGYVAALGWLYAYGPAGLLDDMTGLAAEALLGPLGVSLVLGVEATPLVYLVVAAGLAGRAEPDMERAARASGADAWTAFRTVTLPLLAPHLAGAAAVAFILSVTAFGVPAVLGIPAGFTTVTTRIYRDLAFSSDPASFSRAIALALGLAVAVAVIVAVADALQGRRRATRSGVFAGPGAAPLPMPAAFPGPGSGAQPADEPPEDEGPVPADGRSSVAGRPGSIIAGLVAWILVAIVLVVPLVALLLTALTRAVGLAPVPANWTLANFGEVLDRHTLEALANSVVLGTLAAVGVVVLSGLALLARRGGRAGLTGGALGLTFALPGTTLAVGILLSYGPSLRDTLLIILVAYLAKFWALGYRPIAAGLDGIPADLVRAARVSGASGSTALRTVLLPVLWPMVAAGALLVFLFALHEVTMSSLLYGPGTATLGVVVLDLQQLGDPNLTAAMAVVLTVVVAVAAAPLLARRGALERFGWRP
jgi:iron(III) transport system permease protein